MNLKQFLQLESEKFAEATIDKDDWYLSDHDTRLINKVLDEVREKMPKELSAQEYKEKFNTDNYPFAESIGYSACTYEISTILENLKVK